MAIKAYTLDYKGYFPDMDDTEGLEQLRYNDYLTDYRDYTCPKSRKTEGEYPEKLKVSNIDYIYFSSSIRSNDTTNKNFTNIPLVIDNPTHDKKYLNVLFRDGHTEIIKTKARNCKEVIEFLNKKYQYSPKVYKELYEKAAKADINWELH